MIYDANGNIVSRLANKAGKEIGLITDRLYQRLFKQGMTITEGRALITFLQGQVNVSAILGILKRQCRGQKGRR